MGKFIQDQSDNPIDKSVDEIYELENQVLAEFNKVQIADEDRNSKYNRYFETRKRVETERDKLKSSEQNRNTLSKGKVYPTYTEGGESKISETVLA